MMIWEQLQNGYAVRFVAVKLVRNSGSSAGWVWIYPKCELSSGR